MAPNKIPKSAGPSNSKEGLVNLTDSQELGTTPLTGRNLSMAHAPVSSLVDHGSLSTRDFMDAEDTDGYDGDSNDDDLTIDKKLCILSMSDHAGLVVNTTPSGSNKPKMHSASKSDGKVVAPVSSSTESRSVEKYKVKKASPDSDESSFVRHAAGSHSDDPFSSAYKPPQRRGRQSHSTQVTPTSSRPNTRSQGMWRVGGNSSQNSESPTRRIQAPSTEDTLRISGQNAQSVYSPSACIFVANLSSTETETELEAAVTRMFRRYGTVFVKIRRDPKNMPYAFCQFTDDRDAMHALEDSRGRLIHGRPVRTERARANRLFSFRRLVGNPVTIDECRSYLGRYGTVDSAWYPTADQLNVLQLHGAVLVQFAFFDDGRRAQQGARTEGIYQLDSIANVFQQSSPQPSGRRNQPKSQRAQDYLREYDQDRNSIFVGNLPQDFTEDKVRDMFEHYGTVLKIVIHQKPSQRNPGQLFSYCFVEYGDPMAPNRAIVAKNNFVLEGHALKVVAKNSEYRHPRNSTYDTPAAAAPLTSPPALHFPQTIQPVHNPHGYGYMPTPPSYGYSAYYPSAYTSPWGYNWQASYAFSGPPPTYHGMVSAANTPNPMYNSAYSPQVGYSGQSYPSGSYAYQPYVTQGTTIASVPAQDYQAATDNDNSEAEENNADLQ